MAVIAIDCDDTLSRTNETICNWHNTHYNTDLTIDDFNHFQYWRIREWGDKQQAMTKVHEFNRSSEWKQIPVIEEAVKAIKQLKDAGHTLVIITARMASEAELTRDFIERHFPDCFTEIYFTSAFESRSADAEGGPQDKEAAKKLPEQKGHLRYTSIPKPKSEICKLIGAKVLVDDSIENAFEVHKNAGIPVALYGDWNWNKKEIDPAATASHKSYAQRIADGEEETTKLAVLPDGITRTIQWNEAVALIQSICSNDVNCGE